MKTPSLEQMNPPVPVPAPTPVPVVVSKPRIPMTRRNKD